MTGEALRAPSTPKVGLLAEVAGHGLVRIEPQDMPTAKRRPKGVPEGWSRVTPSLLRYSDEQSIAAVSSVFAAVDRMGGDPSRFADWGVVVASRFLGRANLAMVLRKFSAEGVWGTSPHLIPHFALHSPAGTISLALGAHGPNLGVGGGMHSPAEAFLAAHTWLESGIVPGVWLVLTGWSPELHAEKDGVTKPTGECQAMAIALVASSGGDRPQFRLSMRDDGNVLEGPIDLVRLDEDLKDSPSMNRLIATDPTGKICVEMLPRMAENGR